MKNFLRVLIIIAILIILVLLSVGIVRIVPKALSSLASATVSIGSIFSGNDNTATTTPSTPNQGTTIVPNGNGFIVVGSTTTPSTATSSPSLIDILNPRPNQGYNNYVPAPGSPSPSYRPIGPSSATLCAAGGTPDLAITILSKGVISKTTGQYIETNSFTTGDTVSLRFKAENRGTCPTGIWNLRVQMPSLNAADQLRTVSNIKSIPAGAAVTGQANFDNPQAGNPTVTLTATDSSGRDVNNANNIATIPLTVLNTGTGSTGGTPIIGDGRADLVVRILQIGTLNQYNQFVPSSYGTYGSTGAYYQVGQRVAVKFEVVNQGRIATGAWNFRADFSGSSYNNPQYEASIPAGGKSTYTIGFNASQSGLNTMNIIVDSLNQVNEYSEGNNTASVSFNVTGYQNPGYPYQY